MRTKEENWVQAEALQRMNGDELELIDRYAGDFRKIIYEFEKMHGRIPSADELIWIESEKQGCDITQN